MRLHSIDTGLFKLDGGAMFGVVPQSIWKKLNPPDENNLCTWAMRCLLIESGKRLILIDTGIGNKQAPDFLKFYHLHGDASLVNSIQKKGYGVNDITDVVLTHLHLDHVGGATVRVKGQEEKIVPTFPNAHYWVHQEQWTWATVNPNPREKASFLKENLFPLMESGQLNFIQGEHSPFEEMDFFLSDGHTEKQILPLIKTPDGILAYTADLIPSTAHIPLAYGMAYDVRPLVLMEEKERFLKQALLGQYRLFLEHDPVHEGCTIQQTEKGIRFNELFKL
jgi:glyoxylase-like metal-dependent hydrolase (beta-lactamase superfamily II)